MATKIYHGGCIECFSQEIFGYGRCNMCMYKVPNWSKPDLTIKKGQFKGIDPIVLLESIDFNIIEKFIREKKLENLNKL